MTKEHTLCASIDAIEARIAIKRAITKRLAWYCERCSPKVLFNPETAEVRYVCDDCPHKRIADKAIDELYK